MLEFDVDARRQKSHELADRASITFANGCYTVPSQSGHGSYTVILDDRDALCDCPDFELRGEPGKPCKHIMAARLWRDRQARGVEQDRTNVEPSPKVKRKTYPQPWTEYNAAQTSEQRHFQDLLAELCQTVEEPRRTGRGRKPIPLADQIYAAATKVYSLFSARCFMTQLEAAVERGHVSRSMHFNSVLNALENAALTPILHRLIQASSLPLRSVETTFAPDSSGFCTSRFTRWFDVKYGITREEADWVKVHLMTGVKTNIVTAVVIEDKNAGDAPQMPKLVAATVENFEVKVVPADKGYLSNENLDLVDKLGGTAYIPFKSNSGEGAPASVWEKMYYFFMLNREEFLTHYHQRSNVESTFSAVKRLFGDSVRSKGDAAMKNEVLCKILCYNITCIIHAWYELGIEPVFTAVQPQETEPAVLRFTRPG
jgi:transposase